MQTSSPSLSFGRYLKAIRESKNIALSTVAEQIRVSVWYLTLLEAEDHEKLPDDVYVKGTLRAYAKTIGVDSDDIIERYEINRRAYKQALQSERDLLASGKHSAMRMVTALGALAVVVMFSIMTFNRLDAPSGDTETGGGSADSETPLEFVFFEDTPRKTAESVENNENRAYQWNGRMHLRLVATSENRIELRIDDGKTTYYQLHPKDEIQVEASERLALYVDDTDGIRIYFNGRPVAPEGSPDKGTRMLFRGKRAEEYQPN